MAYNGALVASNLPRRRTFERELLNDKQTLPELGMGESQGHRQIGIEVEMRGQRCDRVSLSGSIMEHAPNGTIGFELPLGERSRVIGKRGRSLE